MACVDLAVEDPEGVSEVPRDDGIKDGGDRKKKEVSGSPNQVVHFFFLLASEFVASHYCNRNLVSCQVSKSLVNNAIPSRFLWF